MKVFVVMGDNNYPNAVFTTEAAAKLYREMKINEPEPSWYIYWRYYEFEAQGTT